MGRITLHAVVRRLLLQVASTPPSSLLVLQTINRRSCTITEKAPTRLSHLRIYWDTMLNGCWVLTPWEVDVKLGCRRKSLRTGGLVSVSSRGLLCDYEPSCAPSFQALVSSQSPDSPLNLSALQNHAFVFSLSGHCLDWRQTPARTHHEAALATIVNRRRLHQSQLSFHRHPSLTAPTLPLSPLQNI